MLSTEVELGAVQSKATKLVDFARFRLGSERAPRSKVIQLSKGDLALFLFPRTNLKL